MLIKNKAFMFFVALFCLNFSISNLAFAQEQAKTENKYPNYANEFLGEDKYENFNRKVFIFNSKLNKYVIHPVHVTWASIMPKYGMDRLQSAYTNIEYPKRLASCLIQKDFEASKKETLRFVTNTTLGLGGLYDPAKKYFKIEPVKEDMEQALAKIKVKRGPYIVLPILSSSSPRDIAGRILECPLDPALYLANPIVAFVKSGFLVNKTSYMQPLSKMVESTYADPYDITRKFYGIENYIKNSNLDRSEVLETTVKIYDENLVETNADVESFLNNDKGAGNIALAEAEEGVVDIKNPTDYQEGENTAPDKISLNETEEENANTDEKYLLDVAPKKTDITPDIELTDYKPQYPVVDSMRTALFELPGIDDSIWSELSVWNRCFSKQIKTSSVSIDPNRENYKYRYILQKDKNAPVAILYPSIGEGITSHHSVVFAKLLYDEGYSVIIQGSHFHWEFVKSMPEDYKPGIPSQDADYLKITTSKIINSLQTKYNCEFKDKIVIGTSFGALTTLFMADKESKNNTMKISKYISISPPIEIIFALKELDKNNEEWNKNPDDIKQRAAMTSAKIIQISQMKNLDEKKIESLPFSEDEAKLITGFIMRQKLSDLLFVIENASKSRKTNIYSSINNISYREYAEKYLLKNEYKSFDDLNFDTSLHSIADFLKTNNNYKIYHTPDDYFISQQQLKKLKEYSGNKVAIVSNGSHLGFLYRKEFIDELKKDIALK